MEKKRGSEALSGNAEKPSHAPRNRRIVSTCVDCEHAYDGLWDCLYCSKVDIESSVDSLTSHFEVCDDWEEKR